VDHALGYGKGRFGPDNGDPHIFGPDLGRIFLAQEDGDQELLFMLWMLGSAGDQADIFGLNVLFQGGNSLFGLGVDGDEHLLGSQEFLQDEYTPEDIRGESSTKS
jgi:hypothetical protein